VETNLSFQSSKYSEDFFFWKASHNLLPTKQNLFVQGVVEDSFCRCCKIHEESTLHALWYCLGAQDVWGSGSALFQKCPADVHNVTDLLELLMHRLDMGNLSLMATLARRIWLSRNRLVFEGMYTPPNVVYADAVLACEDFHHSTLPEIAHSNIEGSVPHGSMAWKPPHIGVVKAKWDASLNKTTGCIGLGCVVRDGLREVLGIKCRYQKVVVEPKLAEVMAALHPVMFCKEVGFLDVVFEGDALQVIQEIIADLPLHARIGHFVDSIR
jgi:hypothetical protein